MRYDYLIVDAGLYWATFAQKVTEAGRSCLVVDRREHIGRNVYTERVSGVMVHRYGTHIFHTNDDDVWGYVRRFADFNRFTHSPMAYYDGRMYSLPFNMLTFAQMWGGVSPGEVHTILQAQWLEAPVEPRNLEEQAISMVGLDIYEKLVKGYTEKQWGRECKDLPASIIRRLPVRMTYDSSYVDALHHGIPVGGYTKMVERIFDNVDTCLGVDYLEYKSELDAVADMVVYTGPIDTYFGYALGSLQYRSVRFESEVLDRPNYQGNAVVNYTGMDVP